MSLLTYEQSNSGAEWHFRSLRITFHTYRDMVEYLSPAVRARMLKCICERVCQQRELADAHFLLQYSCFDFYEESELLRWNCTIDRCEDEGIYKFSEMRYHDSNTSVVCESFEDNYESFVLKNMDDAGAGDYNCMRYFKWFRKHAAEELKHLMHGQADWIEPLATADWRHFVGRVYTRSGSSGWSWYRKDEKAHTLSE